MDNLTSKKIITKSLNDLKIFAYKNRLKYKSSKPYPHIVIKNFFDKSFLNNVVKEFPDLSKTPASLNYNNKNEVKFANNKKKVFKKNTKFLFKFLNSKRFINYLQTITSIQETLLPDNSLSGGGLHEIKKGGVLKIHTDFNKHPFKKLDRRINVLIYLNKNWKNYYGGYLELWNRNMTKCIKKVMPTFNTMVIFSTNDFTNHGHPNPLRCPKTISRRSIATYYFSKGRPRKEITNIYKKNRTEFKDRVGINDDVLIKKEYIKSFLRNLSIYQKIKNLEKKYIRTGNSNKKRKIS
ncbi:2OG-Fe(II) oxygenase [Candidatus Pelagibacter sp.]|nr:2OG-Fe(II) oxygenase [Candidatus Pelagibacter sp.]